MKIYNKNALIFLALLVLSGCMTVGPDYVPPKANVPEKWQSSQIRSDIFKSRQNERLSVWWEQLEDPVLSDLIKRALEANPDVNIAKASLRESRARVGISEADLFPSISAGASASRSRTGTLFGSGVTSKKYSLGFDVDWEIDIFGEKRRAVEAAAADFQASEAELDDVHVSLIAEVARNYANFRNAQNRISIAQKNLDSQSSTLQLTTWQEKAGLASSLEVEQARTNREETRAQIPSLKTVLSEYAHRLSVLLGEHPGTLKEELDTSKTFLKVSSTIDVGIPANILRQRPDIRVAERKLAAETARIGEVQASLYPGVISGSIGVASLSLKGLADDGSETHSLLASLSTTIFDAGKTRRQVVAQTAVQEQALINYYKTLLTAFEEVENALVALANSRERINALEIAVESARNATLLAHDKYSAGLVDFQRVLTTERSLLSVEDNLANTKNDEIISLITLYKALGGGWEEQKPQQDEDATDTKEMNNE